MGAVGRSGSTHALVQHLVVARVGFKRARRRTEAQQPHAVQVLPRPGGAAALIPVLQASRILRVVPRAVAGSARALRRQLCRAEQLRDPHPQPRALVQPRRKLRGP